jgi:hypothetical protein
VVTPDRANLRTLKEKAAAAEKGQAVIALFANIENWDIVCEKFYHQDFVEGTP